MKRFRFPLRPVAVLRANKELRAREAFAAAVHDYVRTEEKLAAARQRQAELEQHLAAARDGTFRAADAATAFRSYRAQCDSVIAAERASIAARDVMNQRRADYLEANRQLKVVHQLEDKARLRHRLENQRAEQTELDEFASLRAFRKPVLT